MPGSQTVEHEQEAGADVRLCVVAKNGSGGLNRFSTQPRGLKEVGGHSGSERKPPDITANFSDQSRF